MAIGVLSLHKKNARVEKKGRPVTQMVKNRRQYCTRPALCFVVFLFPDVRDVAGSVLNRDCADC